MTLSQVEHLYTQNGDCCNQDEWQTLKATTQDSGSGFYIVIETQRWALDVEEIDAFAEKLKSLVRSVEESRKQEEE